MNSLSRSALITLGLIVVITSICGAETILFVDKTPNGNAVVQVGDARSEVAIGDEIPGWGKVVKISDSKLNVERRLTDAEKDDLYARGQTPVDKVRAHIPRNAFLGIPAPGP